MLALVLEDGLERGERENRSYQSRGRRACIAADTGRLADDRKTGG